MRATLGSHCHAMPASSLRVRDAAEYGAVLISANIALVRLYDDVESLFECLLTTVRKVRRHCAGLSHLYTW
jgi:hypothetical protein